MHDKVSRKKTAVHIGFVIFFARLSCMKTLRNIIVNKRHINTTENSEVSNNIVVGDCVKIISGLFQSYYAVVLGSSYGDEHEIQYLRRRKLFLGQNIGFPKKMTLAQEKSVSSRKL